MLLSGELILHALQPLGILSVQGMEGQQFAGVRLQPTSGARLCICRGSELTQDMDAEDCAFITVGEPAFCVKSYAAVDAARGVEEIHGLLQDLFDRFSDFETRLARAALEPDCRALAECAWEMSGKPVIIMDGSLRILALAPDRDFPDDAEWMHMRKYGFASLEGLRSMRESGDFSEMLRREGPLYYDSGVFSNPSIVSSILHGGVFAARVCMTGAFGPLTQADVKIVGMLAAQMEVRLRTNPDALEGVGSSPAYSVLYDLLLGKKLDDRLIADRLGGVLGWERGAFCALAVPAAASDEISYRYYAGLLEHQLDCACVHFSGGLAAVLHLNGPSEAPALTAAVRKFLTENGLAGGMSYLFEDVTQLHGHYGQAVTALGYGGAAPGLYAFSDCAMRYMMDCFPQEKLRILVHPALFALREHDRASGSELYDTLRIYLQNERSLVKTAAALFIHRNTLLYRLEKLHKLVELDLEDPELRLQLELSFRLMERL